MTTYETIVYPDETPLRVTEFLPNPTQLRQTLEARGALDFSPYPSGLFPASALPAEKSQATGMGMAWFRDNAHVANALYSAGRPDVAVPVGQAILTVFYNNRDILDDIVSGRNVTRRLPVRVQGDTLANDIEPRVQNDSVGYGLWLTSRLITDGAIQPSMPDLDTLAQTVRYLEAIAYWKDADEGHWEEDRRLHASSIGTVIAGMRSAQTMFDHLGYRHSIDFGRLLDAGNEALYTILAQGVTDLTGDEAAAQLQEQPFPDTIRPDALARRHFEQFSVRRRQYDAALLFLIEPLGVLEPRWADKIINDIETHLQRPIGIARYIGDTYWEPRFPDILGLEERTSAAEGRTEKRNMTAAGVAYSGTEAQWTLFDPLLSVYWGKRFGATGDQADRQKQLFYLQRSLSQLVPMPDGTLKLPEAYYYAFKAGRNLWIPNDHTPLLWSQANLVSALMVFETTSTTSAAPTDPGA